MPHARTEFEVKSWHEESGGEAGEPPRLVRTRVEKAFAGDLAGESSAEYVMCYTAEREARFVGFEHFTGRLAGRAGSFVLRCEGESDAEGRVTESVRVVEGSGTGDFVGLVGHGRWSGGHAERLVLDLEYEI